VTYNPHLLLYSFFCLYLYLHHSGAGPLLIFQRVAGRRVERAGGEKGQVGGKERNRGEKGNGRRKRGEGNKFNIANFIVCFGIGGRGEGCRTRLKKIDNALTARVPTSPTMEISIPIVFTELCHN